MSLDENLTNKRSGDTIRSADWNALASETIRLDNVKLDRGLIGIQMLQAPSWENKTASEDWQPVISHTVNLEPGTELLLVGQGHGASERSGVALDVVIMVDGTTALGQEDSNGLAWGMGIHQPLGKTITSIFTQIVAIAKWPAELSGVHEVVLAMRSRREFGEGGSVNFSGPTLWLIRLGAN